MTHGEVEDEFERPVSPLEMLPGQINGLDALQSHEHLRHRGQSPQRRGSAASSLFHLQIPRYPSHPDFALAAMQYLPYPLLVLNRLKTPVMGNEAMGRLLGLEEDNGDALSDDGISPMDKLKGQTLSQLGIDMLEEGRPVWVTWEAFLENLSNDMGTHAEETPHQRTSEYGEGDVTPTAERSEPLSRRPSNGSGSTVHDAVVEVVITQGGIEAA
ncbi:hypothetical protein B0J14DRAFT_487364, partial [Halenospora varia]